MAEQETTVEITVEQKISATPLKRDVTPYEIAKYLKDVCSIEIAPQTLYRLRKDGKLPSYSKKVGNRSKWYVKKEDATKLIVEISKGSKKTVDPAW